jgi:diguanylate cyclase (GGDEF)-like protein
MHVLSIPCVIMASINIYVGLYYLFFFVKRPKITEHLPFALMCLSVGLYIAFCAGLYNSSSIQDGIFWQRLQFHTVAAIALFLIWFTRIYTEQKSNRILQLLTAWFIVAFFASLVASPEYSLSPLKPEIKNINLFNLVKIIYYEGALGIVYQVELLSAIAAYIYLFYLFIRFYLRTKKKILLLIILSQMIYFVGVINDSLVAMQVYTFIYISEYSYSFIVVSMAYVLLNKFVDVHAAFEELNVKLEEKVLERTCEIKKLNEDLKKIAEYDDLTGIYNRRFFNEYFEIEVERAKSFIEHKAQFEPAQENGMNFGLAILDIDHFKIINDTYGHPAGDKVLKQITDIMKENMFKRDVLCRYGGDEFVMLLTKTSPDGILQAAEKIRKEIDEHAFVFNENGKSHHVTISMGLVNFSGVHDKNSEYILKLADDRLLIAKNRGKNRVVYRDNV